MNRTQHLVWGIFIGFVLFFLAFSVGWALGSRYNSYKINTYYTRSTDYRICGPQALYCEYPYHTLCLHESYHFGC